MDDNNKDLATIEAGAIMPLSAKILVAQMDAFNKTKGLILKPEDYQAIQGRQFIKKSGWRRLAVAFKLSTEIIKTDIIRDVNGVVISADVIARASYEGGVYREAYGGCDRNEKRFLSMAQKGQEIKGQDIVATAQTRAVNRAISDLVAGGEVSAEEMSQSREYSEPEQDSAPRDIPPASEKQVKMIYAKIKAAGFDLTKTKTAIQDWQHCPIEELNVAQASAVIEWLIAKAANKSIQTPDAEAEMGASQ